MFPKVVRHDDGGVVYNINEVSNQSLGVVVLVGFRLVAGKVVVVGSDQRQEGERHSHPEMPRRGVQTGIFPARKCQ